MSNVIMFLVILLQWPIGVYLPAVLSGAGPAPTNTSAPSATATSTGPPSASSTPTASVTPSATPTSTWTPTATRTFTPAPPVGTHVHCVDEGAAQVCAWISDGAPAPGSFVRVYGRLLVAGAGNPGLRMTSTWHYQSAARICNAATGTDGVATCLSYTAQAPSGYQINVDVTIEGYQATTWFTPQ